MTRNMVGESKTGGREGGVPSAPGGDPVDEGDVVPDRVGSITKAVKSERAVRPRWVTVRVPSCRCNALMTTRNS